jgi:hypothetical protein
MASCRLHDVTGTGQLRCLHFARDQVMAWTAGQMAGLACLEGQAEAVRALFGSGMEPLVNDQHCFWQPRP